MIPLSQGHCLFAISTSLFRSNNGMELLPTYRSVEFKTDISERLSQNLVTLNRICLHSKTLQASVFHYKPGVVFETLPCLCPQLHFLQYRNWTQFPRRYIRIVYSTLKNCIKAQCKHKSTVTGHKYVNLFIVKHNVLSVYTTIVLM